MSQQSISPSNAVEPTAAVAINPLSLMIRAFGEAVDQSLPGADPSEEAGRVESLMIVANATYRALSQTADLRHDLAYNEDDPIGEDLTPSAEENYANWLNAAYPLYKRLLALKAQEYDSRRCDEFESGFDIVKGSILEDFRMRREAERKAMNSDRLIALAARLEASRSPSKVEGGDR